MNKLANSKMIAIIIVAVMIASIFSTIFNVVYAQNNVVLDFQGGTLENGTVVYTVDGKEVLVKLVTKNNDTNQYQDVTITNVQNTPIDLESNDYYLHIDRTNNNNVVIGINGNTHQIPGDNYFGLYSNDFQGGVLLIGIQSDNQGSQNTGEMTPPLHEMYDVIAKFKGSKDVNVTSNIDGSILIPEDWTQGEVEFYARTCTVDGKLKPFNEEMTTYDEGSYAELRLDIEGITNSDDINHSVNVKGTRPDNQVAVFTSDFFNYGRTGLHLCRANTNINELINITTEDLIFVKAEAPLRMSYSFGSATIDNVILTNKQKGDVSIFFGNTETTIIAEGSKVIGITKVVGGINTKINENGTADVTLPPLSTETTTTLTITIGLQGGTSVTKTVNVKRTAIELGFNTADGNATLEAGYVIHKAYLYNNQAHNDATFDAYLQVILYKDGVVAGYKQIQINDEKFVNNLRPNDSGSMELLGDDRIKLYGKDLGDTIEGVNSASVFLTNGPIDFDSDTLPSVEFGIGSGVTIEFGGEE